MIRCKKIRRVSILRISAIFSLTFLIVFMISKHITSNTKGWSYKNLKSHFNEESPGYRFQYFQSEFEQRRKYWILHNYARAKKDFGDLESITYTTHSDFTFLDNLEPLVERWKGPVSIAIYSPGSDFSETIRRISYLRECTYSYLVKSYVTFHIFFESEHIPESPISRDLPTVNCTESPPNFGDDVPTYRKSRNLTYPVNVARNIAKELSTTHFVLASDIELYPSPNLIPQFLEMIQANDFEILKTSPSPKVFVLPIFEVEKEITKLPNDKGELQVLLKSKLAVPFHTYVCWYCHRIPKQEEWLKAKQEPKLGIFHVGKREGNFSHWEPIYIGTKFDPKYDERLSWEGLKDKMTQGYILCALNYEFHILNNAFLIHRPGIKILDQSKSDEKISPFILQSNTLIANKILPDLKILYGNGQRNNCVV